MTASRVGIVCGGGVLPFAVADAVIRGGREVFLIALKGFADAERVARHPHQWVGFGQYGLIRKSLREHEVRDVAFVGGLVRPSLRDVRLDWRAIMVLPTVLRGYRGGDDRLIKSMAGLFESEGFRIVGLDKLAPEVLFPVGDLARRSPDDKARADIALGLDVLKAMSPFDIGQGVVVIDHHVVAVEGLEGTDGLLARIADLRRQHRLKAAMHTGVLVKAPKVGQDMRFDLPSLGPRTMEGLAAAGLAGIAVVAGHSVVAEPETLVALADRHDLFVTGLTDTDFQR
jgi:UDP-2,3-diacylglucosamine hydrolase